MQIPETKYLDKDNKTNSYFLHKELGVRRSNKIHSALWTLAGKYLRDTGLEFPSEFAKETWIQYDASHYDECKLCVLEAIIEPVTPGSRTVKYLFENERLDLSEEEIEALTSGFLASPLYKALRTIDSPMKSTENSQSTGNETEQLQKPEEASNAISPENIIIS